MKEHGRGSIFDPKGCKVCDVECAAGALIGGRTVCPGSLGEGKGPKCRGERGAETGRERVRYYVVVALFGPSVRGWTMSSWTTMDDLTKTNSCNL